MRQFFRVLLMALVLMSVALISALTAMQLAIHGRVVDIPKLTGLSPFEAERAASSLGLQVVVERQFYSADVPEGKIVTQMPPSGTKVRRGWSVRVAQSLGPQRVTIPDVTGGSERVAELNLRRRGLSLGSVAHIHLADSPADRVISQNPPANASGISAPKINMLINDGPDPADYVMPNLAGQPLGSATMALQDAGFKVGKVSVAAAEPDVVGTPGTPSVSPVAPTPNAASVIVDQTPVAGQKVSEGTMVTFEVR